MAVRHLDGERIVVVGGGPAGSLFAICLLREARAIGWQPDLTIIERRPSLAGSEAWHCRGCNSCAGGISPRLNAALAREGFAIPESVIRAEIKYLWIHGQWKNFRLKVPEGMQMCTVMRGSLPRQSPFRQDSLDAFLLRSAMAAGARLVRGEARQLISTGNALPRVAVRAADGTISELPADFIAIAVGANSDEQAGDRSALLQSFAALAPRFVAGQTRPALVCELAVGPAYLRRHLHREIHFVEHLAPGLQLEHVALVPKGQYVTIAMIGPRIDVMTSAVEARRLVLDALALPRIRHILPGLEAPQIVCSCISRLPVTPARRPFADRIALVGDIVGARLYKDGMFSAYTLAASLAQTVARDGVTEATLARQYGRTVSWLAAENRYGRVVFRLCEFVFSRPLVSRFLYQAFATERKRRRQARRPIGTIMWYVASGAVDYRRILTEISRPAALWSASVGVVRTLRNVMIEKVVGIQWGEYGRYPTFVLREKRDFVRGLLAARLGPIPTGRQFEHMAIIKIKAPAETVAMHLARFGEPTRNYIKLRGLGVSRVAGVANEVGAVVRYRLRPLFCSIDLRLTRNLDQRTIVYEVGAPFFENGQLVFHINPTQDGHFSLTVYTAFDFRRGAHWYSRLPRWCFRALFPGFLHDIIWNHAVCAIKEAAEKTDESQAAGSGDDRPPDA